MFSPKKCLTRHILHLASGYENVYQRPSTYAGLVVRSLVVSLAPPFSLSPISGEKPLRERDYNL